MTEANEPEVRVPRATTTGVARRATAFEILAEAHHLLCRYAATFAGIASISVVPALALDLASELLGVVDPFLLNLLLIARAGVFAANLLAIAAISCALRSVFGGDEPRVVGAVSEAMGVLGRLLWTYIVCTFGLSFGLVPVFLVGAPLVDAIGAVPVGLILALPGLYLVLSLTVIDQVVVFERRRGTDALSRSWILMSGQRSKALLAMLGAMLLAVLGAALLFMLWAGAVFLLTIASSPVAVKSGLGAAVTAPAALAFLALVLAYFEIVRALIYLDIRTSVEAMTLADLRRQ